MTNVELLREIEPQLEQAYEEHMQAIAAKDPDEPDRRPFSPVAEMAKAAGTDADPLEYGPVLREEHEDHILNFGERFGVDLRSVLAASFLVNLLTEDNLPHYTSRIHSTVNQSPALMVFANEWTAEEATHGILMRDLALLTGMIGDRNMSLISHAEYDQGHTRQLRSGTEINPPNLQSAFAYLTLQELLTKEAHNKLSWLLAPSGRKVMRPISGDEQNHYEYYRKASEAALQADPDASLIEMERVYTSFSMPGRVGIPRFDKHALAISTAGIFDLETIAKAKRTIVDKLAIQEAEPATSEGKRAQESLLHQTTDEAIADQQAVMESMREIQPAETANGLAPFILGRTIDFAYQGAPGHERPVGLVAIAA